MGERTDGCDGAKQRLHLDQQLNIIISLPSHCHDSPVTSATMLLSLMCLCDL